MNSLPESFVCNGCGEIAGDFACGRPLDEANATDRNFVEVHGKWNGERCVEAPDETCVLDHAGKQLWEVCGNCGDLRWNAPNTLTEPQ